MVLPPEDVGPGAVVLIPPGTRQRITNTGDADLIFLAVCTPRFTLAGYEDVEPIRRAGAASAGTLGQFQADDPGDDQPDRYQP